MASAYQYQHEIGKTKTLTVVEAFNLNAMVTRARDMATRQRMNLGFLGKFSISWLFNFGPAEPRSPKPGQHRVPMRSKSPFKRYGGFKSL